MVIKRISPLSLGKIQALAGIVIGLIVGLLMFVMGTVLGSFSSASGVAVPRGGLAMMGGLSIIMLPILYGIFGFVGGVIGAWVYNIVAKWIGGIEIDLEQKA